jgi:hypothetical protein
MHEESDLDLLASELDEVGKALEVELRDRWRRSRSEQGKILKAYRDLYKPKGLFGKFLEAIRLPSKTAYRLIGDAHSVVDLPEFVIRVAESNGIDLARHKFRSTVEALRTQLDGVDPDSENARQIVSNLIEMTKRQHGKPVPGQGSRKDIEAFAERMARAFEAHFKDGSPDVRESGLRYVFEFVAATLRSPIRELTQYGRPALVPKPPKREDLAA